MQGVQSSSFTMPSNFTVVEDKTIRNKRLVIGRRNGTAETSKSLKMLDRSTIFSGDVRRSDFISRKVRRRPSSEEADRSSEEDVSAEIDDASSEERVRPVKFERRPSKYNYGEGASERKARAELMKKRTRDDTRVIGEDEGENDSEEDDSEETDSRDKKKFDYDTIYGKTSYIWDDDDGWQPFGGDKSTEDGPPPPRQYESEQYESDERTVREKDRDYEDLDGYIKEYIDQIHQDPSLNKFLDLKVYEKIAEAEYEKAERQKRRRKSKKNRKNRSGKRTSSGKSKRSRTKLTVRRVPKVQQRRPHRYFFDYKPVRNYGYK